MMLTPEQRDDLKAEAYGRGFVHYGLLRAVLAHIDAQQARIAELEQDAARYRWLRQFAHPVSDSTGIFWHVPLIAEDKTGNSLNDAIDVAMKEEQQ